MILEALEKKLEEIDNQLLSISQDKLFFAKRIRGTTGY